MKPVEEMTTEELRTELLEARRLLLHTKEAVQAVWDSIIVPRVTGVYRQLQELGYFDEIKDEIDGQTS